MPDVEQSEPILGAEGGEEAESWGAHDFEDEEYELEAEGKGEEGEEKEEEEEEEEDEEAKGAAEGLEVKAGTTVRGKLRPCRNHRVRCAPAMARVVLRSGGRCA